MTGFAGIFCDLGDCDEQYAVTSTPGISQVSPTMARFSAAREGWRTERVPGGVTRDLCPNHRRG